MDQNDAELDRLIERCRRDDNEAWRDLLQRFDPFVARWLARCDYRLLEQDIADLRQKVFKKLWQELPKYEGEVPFSMWLYLMTERLAIDERRTRSALKRQAPGGLVSIHGEESGLLAPSPSPDELVAGQDDHRLLFEALDHLGPPENDCRQLIGMVYFGGFTYDEVAQTLKTQAWTARRTLGKCLDRLREIVNRICRGGKGGNAATGS